jgi:hypothetical protein
MFKFALNQEIWYLDMNKVHCAPVISRRCIDNSNHEGGGSSSFYQQWGRACIEYKTCHGIVEQDLCFASKEELLASL